MQGLEKFWSVYVDFSSYDKSEHFCIDIKEVDNETIDFSIWRSTIKKNDDHPEIVGKTAEGPIVHRLIWENEKIKVLQVIFDAKSRDQQLGKVE